MTDQRAGTDRRGGNRPETMADQRGAALRRVAAPPYRAPQPIAQLLVLGLDPVGPQVEPAEEFPGLALLRRPVAQQRRGRVDRKPARQDVLLVLLAGRRVTVGDVAH